MNAPAHVISQESATAWLVERLLSARWEQVPQQARTVAKQCLLDWIGVAMAARDEPLVKILVSEFADEIQKQECSLVGYPQRVSAATAAFINGAMSHALDFDDVITGMGHPTAPVAPAALAVGESLNASGRDVLLSFILGVEAETRIGRLVGPSHYADGWHATATLGTFGAATASAKLMNLNKQQLLHAYGLAGTQAAGLKSMFGTMTKPFHPGKSAQNGILAARLGKAGYTSDENILGSSQGFVATQSRTASVNAMTEDADRLVIEDALFKYHAACYMTHDSIEASAALRGEHKFAVDEIADVRVRVRQNHLGVCNIQDPRSGLECKFSLRMTTAMALSGEDTFSTALYSDETAIRPDLIALRQKVAVEPSAGPRGSIVELRLKDGRLLSKSFDVAVPLRDLGLQQEKIERKFRHLVEPIVGKTKATEIVNIVRDIEDLDRIERLTSLIR